MASVISLFVAAIGSAGIQEMLINDVMAADATRVIGNNVLYSVFDIVKVKAADGTVTLEGIVTEPYKKTAFAQDVLKQVPGVKEVKNNIEVLPPSTTDDMLRLSIARKIYSNENLLRYGLTKWPHPIHIIVRNGHVQLVGQVENEMDRNIVNNEVREISGIVSVKNDLTTDSEHKKTD